MYYITRNILLEVRLRSFPLAGERASLIDGSSPWLRLPARTRACTCHTVLLVGSSVLLCRVLRDVPSSLGRAFCRLDMAAVRSMSMRV